MGLSLSKRWAIRLPPFHHPLSVYQATSYLAVEAYRRWGVTVVDVEAVGDAPAWLCRFLPDDRPVRRGLAALYALFYGDREPELCCIVGDDPHGLVDAGLDAFWGALVAHAQTLCPPMGAEQCAP